MAQLAVQESNKSIVEKYVQFKNLKDTYKRFLRSFAEEINKPIPECDELDVTKFLEFHSKTGGA